MPGRAYLDGHDGHRPKYWLRSRGSQGGVQPRRTWTTGGDVWRIGGVMGSDEGGVVAPEWYTRGGRWDRRGRS